jgi:GMP synthase-like glutamine amidotransferase
VRVACLRAARPSVGVAMAANGAAKHASSVLVLDYGSQYTQLICRRVRELGVYSVMMPGDVTQARRARGGLAPKRLLDPNNSWRATLRPARRLRARTRIADAHRCARTPQERVRELAPSVVILSGGPNSVHEPGSPTVPAGFFEWAADAKVPVLGICYGMQLLVQCLGGEVAPAEKREYGRMPIHPTAGCRLFADGASQMVWMSHGDEAKRLPDGFTCVAKSEQARAADVPLPWLHATCARALAACTLCLCARLLTCCGARQGAVVAIECAERNVYGLQYHPEARGAPHVRCARAARARTCDPTAVRGVTHASCACTPRHVTQVTHTDRGLETLRRFLFDIANVSAVRPLLQQHARAHSSTHLIAAATRLLTLCWPRLLLAPTGLVHAERA